MDDVGPKSADPPSPGGEASTLSIDVVDDGGALGRQGCRWVADRARDALRPLALAGEVRARVVDDAAMASAHERWAGVRGTTDVLTFDLRESPTDPLDVDLLVCLDEARRQAETRAIPPERELLLYVIHGVLHCLGFDDHDDAHAARMHAEEDRLLDAAGIGATFTVAPSHTMPEREGRVAPAGSPARETH